MAESGLTEAEANRIVQNKARVSALYLEHATAAYARAAQFEPWRHYAFACLARAHYALDSIFLLRQRAADQAALTRVLYEHVVAFAWLMIEPPSHYLALLSWEHEERKKMRTDMAKYASSPVPTEAEVTRLMVAEGLDLSVKPARATPDRALAADAHWTSKIAHWPFSLRRAYPGLFRAHSANVHPTVMGLLAFSPANGRVNADVRPILEVEAVMAFCDALTIASETLNWPPQHATGRAVFYGLDDTQAQHPVGASTPPL